MSSYPPYLLLLKTRCNCFLFNCSFYSIPIFFLFILDKPFRSTFQAQECLLMAPTAAGHVEILTFLARLCEQRNDIKLAIEAQKKALEVGLESDK